MAATEPSLDDNFAGRSEAPQPKLGDSSDKKVARPHRNASWPPEKLVEFVRANPFCTLAPGEGFIIVEHFEQRLTEMQTQLDAASETIERLRDA